MNGSKILLKEQLLRKVVGDRKIESRTRDEGRPGSLIFHRQNRAYSER